MISDKEKHFLYKKLEEKKHKLRRLKWKHRIIKCLYGGSIVISVVLSITASAMISVLGPTTLILCFTTTSAIATTLSTIFNLKKKNKKLQVMRDELTKLKDRLDYVVSCNGNLSEAEYNEILKEFT